jgi:hypothetical protein
LADLNEILQLLHTGLAEKLLERVQSGEVTASDLNVARQFLKDNGIDSAPKEGSPLDNLARSLPFTAEDEDEQAAPLPN